MNKILGDGGITIYKFEDQAINQMKLLKEKRAIEIRFTQYKYFTRKQLSDYTNNRPIEVIKKMTKPNWLKAFPMALGS